MVFSGLNIDQADGLTEMHFGILVLLALLLCYEDWRVVVCAAGVIAVHHVLSNYLQATGHGIFCLSKPGFGLIIVHAIYVVIESLALCFLAVTARKQTLATAASAAALQEHFDCMRSIADKASIAIVSIATAAHELARSSEAMAAGAQEQAASLEETSASLEQITSTVQQSSSNATEANHLAESSGESAERGGLIVADTATAMIQINAASARIADIISIIDEIAFQTNLLAVNAAVEAAHAGDEGRGFAVVATEVRTLSHRTAGAAKEVKALIQDCLVKVELGTKLVNRSGETLTDIVGSVNRVRRIMGDLATASQEQSTGIQQVNSAVAQMDRATQSNAAQTEQVAATAQSLSRQSASLKELISSL